MCSCTPNDEMCRHSVEYSGAHPGSGMCPAIAHIHDCTGDLRKPGANQVEANALVARVRIMMHSKQQQHGPAYISPTEQHQQQAKRGLSH